MLFEQIRRDSRVEGLSVRALAKRHRVHRRTVRQALASAMPPEPARRRWQSRKIDPFVDAIDAMLRSDLTAPRKQRHTAVRVLDRLVDEHQATGLSYSTLRAYVAAETIGRERLGGATAVSGHLADLGGLAPGVSREEARDMIWTLTSPEVYRMLVVERGWSDLGYERWLAQALKGSLLGGP